MRTIGVRERRARLARRHGIAPGCRLDDPVAAARAVVALHATEAASVYLALQARVSGLTVEDVETALYRDRSLVKQLAMRRTLFAFPRDLLPAVLGSTSVRVAQQQRGLIARDVVKHGVAEDGEAWIDAAAKAVLGRLDAGEELTAAQLREQVPELAGRFRVDPSKKYGGDFHMAPRLLTLLGAEGRITRAHNAGHWRTSRPAWSATAAWLGEEPAPLGPEAGWAELVRRWLRSFGPGTEADLVWWLGATKTAVRAALAAVGAVAVGLEGGSTGWVLPDDLDPEPEVEPWAALLPVLDPTTMGWKERDFYLAPEHIPYLFDSVGNGGTTVWWDGRIVGAWVQDEDGVVVPRLREDIGSAGRTAVDAEAARLTAWLDGVVITNVYKSALMQGSPLP